MHFFQKEKIFTSFNTIFIAHFLSWPEGKLIELAFLKNELVIQEAIQNVIDQPNLDSNPHKVVMIPPVAVLNPDLCPFPASAPVIQINESLINLRRP